MTRTLTLKQDFYKAVISLTTGTGSGKIYVSVLPTRSAGYMVISSSNSTKREIVYYTTTGTDGTGNYINIASAGDRGLGGTTAQVHVSQEPIRMNITSLDWEDMVATFTGKFDTTNVDTDGTLAANSDTRVASQKAVKTYAMALTYLSTDPTFASNSDFLVPSQKAAKAYMDGLALAGAPNASTTQKGIVEIATQTEVDNGTDTGGTGAATVVQPSQLASINAKTYVAGEALTANDALILAAGTESAVVSAISTTNTAEDTTNGWWYQSFTTGPNTTSIVAVTMRVNTGGGASSYTYRIRSTPAGSDLGSINSGTLNVGDSELTLTFGTPVTVTPSTVYYIVVTGPRLRGGTTSSYSGGVSGTSSTAGASWVTPATTVTGDFYFKVYEGYTVTGKVYKSCADSSLFIGSQWTTNFIGFAKTTVTSGSNVSVQLGGVYSSLSGLTPGLTYYLSNTAGAIASSAGTVSKKIGLAVSATALLIKHDN